MKRRRSIASRLLRAFLLQGLLVGMAGIAGVLLATALLEDNLIRAALEGEAEHFWDRRRMHPDFPLPDTRNMRGYLSGGEVPERLRRLDLGFHSLDGAGNLGVTDVESPDVTVAYVTARGGQRLYLVFAGKDVLQLATVFGLAPLAFGIGVLYLVLFISYRLSQSAVSPVIWLAREVNRLDPESPEASHLLPERLPEGFDAEVTTLAAAIGDLSERVREFVQRERLFTRDASHELRSPLTVIKVAADMLLEEPQVQGVLRQDVERISRAVAHMQGVIETLLLLAREDELGLSRERVSVNEVLSEELDRARDLLDTRPLELELLAQNDLQARAPRAVLSAVFGNLIRNAVTYTERGRVTVIVEGDAVRVHDTGIGMDSEQLAQAFQPYFRGEPATGTGLGVGLSIVRRLCDRFGWRVGIESMPGVGTVVTVDMGNSAAQQAEARSEGSTGKASKRGSTSRTLRGSA